MEKLTQQNIQFIDTYLQNSDVKHVDIRLEMVDHVATAIETKMAQSSESFYYVFKDYMVENKRRLLEDNKQFIKAATTKLSNGILKTFIKPLHLFFMFFISYLSFYSYNNVSHEFTDNVLFFSIIGLIFLPIIVYGVALKVYKFERISSTERINFFIIVLVHFIQLINILNTKLFNDYINSILMSLLFGLLCNFVFSLSRCSLTIFRNCKMHYQTILR